MKLIVQRVEDARLKYNNEELSIGQGVVIFVEINSDKDTKKEVEYAVRKSLNTRIFPDEQGRPWNKSVKEKNFEILFGKFFQHSLLFPADTIPNCIINE